MRQWIGAVVLAANIFIPPTVKSQTTAEPNVESITNTIVLPSCIDCHRSFNDLPRYYKDYDPRFPRRGVIVKGQPDLSHFYTLIKSGRMPPERYPQYPRVSDANLAVIRQWIETLGTE